ncbi:hypothetical protein BN14_00167 [Rhizoctonia solani AG-1 IB]|uniref:Phosphatidic acid phosphatase type 2/haloperoxidase domain-containing protein n=2 Tax=Rhizoctonia solani TaxID=456999 RepID=A0A8H2WVS1_9AGAM|nr:unnamed protein product [Rhizoctonia solani]CCO26150.1 hypothetical protein BN14_00167 [Rhizoctonia solani AG-1 IB]
MSFTVTSPRGTTYLRIDDPPYALTQRPVPARSNSDRNSSPDQHAPPAVPMLPQLTKNTSATLTTASSSSGRLVPKRKMKLLLTYGADCIIFYLLDEIEGFKRQFSLTDTSIQHTFAVHERVPPWLLYIVALIAPAVIMPIVNLLTAGLDFYWGLVQRAHLPKWSKLRSDAQDPIYLTDVNLGLRTMDYRHHWQDVLIGSIVGLVLSYFSYRQYYPSLASPFSHRPYSPRIPRYEQDQAGIPSPEPAPAAAPVQSGPAPVGESIELEGTVKRGGQDLSDMYKKERDGERSQNQQQAVVHGDASQQV